jgi:hypothetical protein
MIDERWMKADGIWINGESIMDDLLIDGGLMLDEWWMKYL